MRPFPYFQSLNSMLLYMALCTAFMSLARTFRLYDPPNTSDDVGDESGVLAQFLPLNPVSQAHRTNLRLILER